MDAVELLRQQFQLARRAFEGTLADVTTEQLNWQPPGAALPIVAHCGHALSGQDINVNELVKGGAPLATTNWEGRTGFSELPPRGQPWGEWARRVQGDLPVLREYARAVFDATEELLKSIGAADLDRMVDPLVSRLGQRPVGVTLSLVIADALLHAGELSCLKGLRGAKGYPM